MHDFNYCRHKYQRLTCTHYSISSVTNETSTAERASQIDTRCICMAIVSACWAFVCVFKPQYRTHRKSRRKKVISIQYATQIYSSHTKHCCCLYSKSLFMAYSICARFLTPNDVMLRTNIKLCSATYKTHHIGQYEKCLKMSSCTGNLESKLANSRREKFRLCTAYRSYLCRHCLQGSCRRCVVLSYL